MKTEITLAALQAIELHREWNNEERFLAMIMVAQCLENGESKDAILAKLQ